jgi:hypothetical protein
LFFALFTEFIRRPEKSGLPPDLQELEKKQESDRQTYSVAYEKIKDSLFTAGRSDEKRVVSTMRSVLRKVRKIDLKRRKSACGMCDETTCAYVEKAERVRTWHVDHRFSLIGVERSRATDASGCARRPR